MAKKEDNICWNSNECVSEMNRFYDKHHSDMEVQKHLFVFKELLNLSDTKDAELLDLGTGTALISEFCTEHKFFGADLPHILAGCAMRNYPQYFYRALNIISDDLTWIEKYPILTMNAVIDVMEKPLEILDRVLKHTQEYLIIHRQEITEQGETRVTKNPSYNSFTYHSIINRADFIDVIENNHFSIIKELPLEFGNWENGGSSFLLRKKRTWALNKIDWMLDKIFKRKENGFFIEAGASDGIKQSNTMFLEFYRNWRGVLIEPIYELYEQCKQNRSAKTNSYNYALVSSANKETVDLCWSPESYGLLGFVNEETNNVSDKLFKMRGSPIVNREVQATTLNNILVAEKLEEIKIDLLSLDVEGYELEVLKGLDLKKWNIEYILVEELQKNDEVKNYLEKYYQCVDKLTEQDYLYKRKY